MNHKCIVISRQYGSGGRQIGLMLAKKLGIPFYDKEIIEHASNLTHLASSLFQENEQINRNLLANPSLGLSLVDEIYLTQYNTIVELARKGPCVIVGHGAGGILKDRVPILNVFIYADFESRKKRAIEEYGESKNKVEKKMMDIDKKRADYFKFYTGIDGKQMDNYQLCLHSGQLGISSCVEIIQTAYKNLD